jgi:oligopeptide transport system substrate-binding protein
MGKSKVSRREFIKFAGITGGAALLTACAPQVVTQVVRETQIVEQTQIVSQTEVVEVDRLVTATPPPQITTPQGRVLPPDAAPLEKQIFRQAGGELSHMDTARDIYQSMATNLGNEPLLRNNENIETVPALAESWTAGPNAEYWDFVIREGAVWSDGEPITADDVVYTYRHMANPALANPWLWFYGDIKGVAAVGRGEADPEAIGVEALDERTVRIHGEFGSIPYLPALLSYQAAVIVPQHVAEADPEGWATDISTFVSGGPYIPTVWEHNQLMEWEINPLYNGPHKPAIQKVVTPLFAAGAPQFPAFLNKEVDLKHILEPAELAAARADPKLNPLIHFFNNFQSGYLQLDTFNPPLDNLDFRKALAHAIDRDILAQQVLNGTFVAGYSMLPPGFPAYNPELKVHQQFDLEAATAALEASGVDPASVTLELYSAAATGVEAQMLQFAKEQWETNLGIKANLNVVEAAVWNQMRADHAMQVFRGQYEYDYVDPSNMLTGLFRSGSAAEGLEGSNRHAWKNEEFDQLVTDAGAEADVEQRLQMYQQAEEILVSDVGVIFLAHQVVFQIWWPWLVGMAPNADGNTVFRWLDISRFQMYIHQNVDELMASA